jgi:hypothetical protein
MSAVTCQKVNLSRATVRRNSRLSDSRSKKGQANDTKSDRNTATRVHTMLWQKDASFNVLGYTPQVGAGGAHFFGKIQLTPGRRNGNSRIPGKGTATTGRDTVGTR